MKLNPKQMPRGLGDNAAAAMVLSTGGGLRQFDACLDRLAPGAFAFPRHGHETGDEMGDEMGCLLCAKTVLIEDSATTSRARKTACWLAGAAPGHRLANRSTARVRYSVIGTRHPHNASTVPSTVPSTDHDLITHKDGSVRRYLRRDGTAYPDRRTA